MPSFYKSLKLGVVLNQRIRKLSVYCQLKRVIDHAWQDGLQNAGAFVKAGVGVHFDQPHGHVVVNHEIIA